MMVIYELLQELVFLGCRQLFLVLWPGKVRFSGHLKSRSRKAYRIEKDSPLVSGYYNVSERSQITLKVFASTCFNVILICLKQLKRVATKYGSRIFHCRKKKPNLI